MTTVLDQVTERNIASAQALFARFGAPIAADGALSTLLARYRTAIDRTGAAMQANGVVATCTRCATQGAGSCCFHGIEEGYDDILLLINLLLGCALPTRREVADSCYFVGDRGCKLLARYYFCLHYLCPELQKLLGPEGSQRLLKTLGEELAAGWHIEQRLRQWLKERAPS